MLPPVGLKSILMPNHVNPQQHDEEVKREMSEQNM